MRTLPKVSQASRLARNPGRHLLFDGSVVFVGIALGLLAMAPAAQAGVGMSCHDRDERHVVGLQFGQTPDGALAVMQLQLVRPDRREDELFWLPVSGHTPDFTQQRIDLTARPAYADSDGTHHFGESGLHLRVEGNTGTLEIGGKTVDVACDWELG